MTHAIKAIADRDREAVRARLRDDFRISSLLMPVPEVARLLGVSSSTLYAYIRDGIFFMPYRRVNKTPMVAVDDFVDWYCAGRAELNKPRENATEQVSKGERSLHDTKP